MFPQATNITSWHTMHFTVSFLPATGPFQMTIQRQPDIELPTTKFISIPLFFSRFTANFPINPLPTVALSTEIFPLLSRELMTRVQWLVHTDRQKEGLGSKDVRRSGGGMVREEVGDGGQQHAEFRQSLQFLDRLCNRAFWC